jgi:hypothetical protein
MLLLIKFAIVCCVLCVVCCVLCVVRCALCVVCCVLCVVRCALCVVCKYFSELTIEIARIPNILCLLDIN